MKNFLTYLFLGLFAAFLVACGGKDNSGDSHDQDTDTQTDDENDRHAAGHGSTICLWGEVGLRDGPGRNGVKYLTTVYFGERVESTGDTAVVEGDDRIYIKVKLSDGTTGWASRYLFAENAELGAATKLTTVYKRPDLVTATDKKLNFGDIVAVIKEEGDWVEVMGKEKSINGWIKGGDHLTTEGDDVSVAILRNRALAKANANDKKKALEAIVENSDFANSIFASDIPEMLDELDPMKKLQEGQLMITADNVNVRSSPNTEEENKVFQLNNGAICDILEVGDEANIGGTTSNWYRISSSKGEGWVFGSFAIVNIEQ